MKALFLAALAVVMPSSAQASEITSIRTGNDLMYACESNNAFEFALCGGYLNGFLDGLGLGSAVRGSDKIGICWPAGFTNGQLRDVVLKYLRDNPGSRSVVASGLVYDALYKVWGCDGAGKVRVDPQTGGIIIGKPPQ